jgi:hypothetical protein
LAGWPNTSAPLALAFTLALVWALALTATPKARRAGTCCCAAMARLIAANKATLLASNDTR